MSSFFVNLNMSAQDFEGSLHAEFSKPYRLRGEWEVGIYSCHMVAEEGMVWVFGNFVDFSYVNGTLVRLMDVVDVKDHKNGKPMYVKVMKKTLSSINIEFKRFPSSETNITNTDIVCIL